MSWWKRWQPSKVVITVFATELLGLWLVAGMKYVYDITLDPVDVRINMLFFTTIAAWWVDGLTRAERL